MSKKHGIRDEAKLWYEAWKATRQEDLVIKVKFDVDWLWLALGIILLMLAYKEIFR
jgi:hypothetical protein